MNTVESISPVPVPVPPSSLAASTVGMAGSSRNRVSTPAARQADERPGSAAGVIDTPGLRDSTTDEPVVWVVWVGGGMRSPSGEDQVADAATTIGGQRTQI